MAQQIEVPGMGVVEFPDGMSDAAISAAIKRNLAPQSASTTDTVVGGLKEVGRVADKAVRGGLLALPGLVGDAAVGIPNWLARKVGVLEESQAVGAPGQMMWPSDALKTITGGELAKPQTEVGKAAGNIGEAIISTVAGGPGIRSAKELAAAAPALAGIGAGAGVGGEVAGRLFEDIPLARAAGGLLGGGAVAAKQAFSANNTDKVARTMMEGVSRRDIEEALRMQKESAAAGLDLNLGQAMGRETNIDAVLASLANTTEGKQTTALLRSQPGQIKLGTEMAVQALPGKVRAPLDIANRSQETATEAIKQAQKAATAAWQDKAKNVPALPETVVSSFDRELAKIAARYPNTARAEMVNDVRQALLAPGKGTPASTILGADGLPAVAAEAGPKYLTDALQVKGAIDDVLQNFGSRKLNTPGTTGKELQTAQEIRELFSKPGGVLETYAPQLTAANRAYEAVIKGTVNPLKKSFVGGMAGRTGAVDDANAAGNKLLGLMDKGTHPDATRSEILTVARQLNKQDPELFLDAGKTWIADKLQKALNSPDARDTASTATRVVSAFGAPGKASNHTKGLSDVLAGMAEAQNLPPSALQALPKFLDYVAHAAARPSSTQGATGSDIAALAADSVIGRVGHVSMLTAARQPILAYTNRLQANTRAELDRLLTTPEGIRMLHTLSTTSPWTERGQKAISVFLGTNAAAQAGDGGNSPGITAE